MELALVFPHQLFKESPLIKEGRKIYLIEEHLFFIQYPFHKQKLAFHRASMKGYQAYLTGMGLDVVYIEAKEEQSDIRKLIEKTLAKKIHIIDPVDNYLERRIKETCTQRGIELYINPSPAFIHSKEDLKSFFRTDKKKFFQTEFYKNERKRLNILLDNGGPEGGKWTYDAENRKKYPIKKIPPSIDFPNVTEAYLEACSYVEHHFPDNYGTLGDCPLYPTDFESAEKWLSQFLLKRFDEFGAYEDAIVASESILHHSVLSPLINSGLLLPDKVVERILSYAREQKAAINNTEGIIRQIIGWREFIRGVYEVKGTEERTRNFWGFTRPMPKSFYDGSTGIDPVDIVIKKALSTGYNHHIERLMVLGNFMLLCEIHPDEVYRWFMEMYIDAYDWVMVPNVYGMSQFADGGLMSTKPYISGSNYLMKMSDFPKGDWQKVWDALFWRFLHVHRGFFMGNPRLNMLLSTFDKMHVDKRNSYLENAEKFLENIDR